MTEQDTQRITPSAPDTPSQTDVHLKNLYELLAEGLGHLVTRDRDERRWKIAKRTALSGVVLGGIGMWVALYAPMFGWSSPPTGSVLGVVPIDGVIGRRGASASEIIPALDRACTSRQVKAVVLRINSPGGSPTDAERISATLDRCRTSGEGSPGKPVIALIEGTGASAAYMVAVHADEILTGRYALVGSIGAVMRTVDAQDAMVKLGLKERVYASGELKGANSPWTSNTPEQDSVTQSLVDNIGELFAADVVARRGDKLQMDEELFTGRVWLGTEATRLGLADGVSTFETLKAERFEDLPVHEFRPTQTFQDRLGLTTMLREIGVGMASELEGVSWK